MKEILLNLSKKQKIVLSIVVLLILGLLIIYIFKNLYETDSADQIILNNEINETKANEENIGIIKSKEKVVVHVIGEVNNPGVVILEEGSRIIDAINSAGGKTEETDLSKINLAYIIEDGIQIYVPRINENLNNVEVISADAGEGVVSNSTISENNNVKVNINTANKEKLETLPGIGESTAQKIIEYREQNGKFKTIEDIQNVSGIGTVKYNSLKDKITV